MSYPNKSKPFQLSKPKISAIFSTPVLLYLIPALTLLAYWVGGETGLLIAALAVPLIAGFSALVGDPFGGRAASSAASPLMAQELFVKLAEVELNECRKEGRKTAVFNLQFDDFKELVDRHGQAAADNVIKQATARIRATLRSDDLVGALQSDGFAICLAPQPSLDLEVCLQLAGRLSGTLEEPFSVDGVSIYTSACIGFCQLGRETSAARPDGVGGLLHADPCDAVIICAGVALQAALTMSPAAIRAYAPDMKSPRIALERSESSAAEALENGEIIPWFQPQISTDTGKITGFESLARWIDPQRGPISPADFLPQLEAAHKMGRLCEVMIYHAMTALKAWDQAGMDIQQVGVNFSPVELSDPELINKVAWELDRFELSSDRLAVEILETVVAQGPDDVITRNIKGLADLGCRIDLDDFGTGHASLASIRRFGVGRIKIDRSFVMKSDRDPEQQRMIRAILTMAERLNLETLAEGVETVGEHALLAQLGCTHVQGFGIGRPMPFDQTLAWIQTHNDKLQDPPAIGKAAR